MYTVIGVERKIGSYEGYNYDNTLIYVSEPISKKGEGVRCSTLKIKTCNLDEAIELGFVIDAYFDKYHNCTKIVRKE